MNHGGGPAVGRSMWRPSISLFLVLLLAGLVRGQSRVEICCGPPPPAWEGLQDERGAWDVDALRPALPGYLPARTDRDLEVTALAALLFLGEGNLPDSGFTKARLAKALAFLLGQQRPDGGFGCADLADEGLVIFTLAEAYRRSFPEPDSLAALAEPVGGEVALTTALQRAVGQLERRSRWSGGWSLDGERSGPLDPVATLWAGLAMESARQSGLADTAALLARTLRALRLAPGSTDRARVAGWVLQAAVGERPEVAVYLDELREDPDAQARDHELMLLVSLLSRFLGEEQSRAQDRVMKLAIERTNPFHRTWRDLAEEREVAPEDVAALEASPLSLEELLYRNLTLLSYFRYGILIGWE